MRELYYDTKRLWGVFFDEGLQKYYIEVECGGVGMFGVRVPMTAEEVALFQQAPKNLNALAYEIAKRPEQFKTERNTSSAKP